MLSLEEAKRFLSYSPDTGLFVWNTKPCRRIRKGSVAGTLHIQGYWSISIFGERYLAHRLAWFFMTGVWPEFIDHIDGVRLNNRFSNLRNVSQGINNQNIRRPRSSNSTGFLGVSKHGSGFRAVVQLNGKQYYLGTHKSPEHAHAIYLSAKRLLHKGNTL